MEGMTYRLVSEKLVDDFVESINYDKMKLNLTQADINNTIKTVEDYNNAIPSLTQALMLNPDNSNIYYNLRLSYYSTKVRRGANAG